MKELIEDAGILLFFLPPYSPDYNPIEELFSYLKYYLKEHEDLIQALPNPIPIIEAALECVTSYPARACAKGLRNRFCPSVSLSVCPVKNFEIRTFTRLKDCCTRQ